MADVIGYVSTKQGVMLLKDVSIQVNLVRTGNLGSWEGWFTAPSDSGIECGGYYILTASDGRTGEFIVSGMSSTPSYITVRFTMNGPFANT